MNKARFNKLQTLIERLAKIQAELESLQEQEQAAFDNASENVQESDRGAAMEEAVGNIEQATYGVQEAIDAATLAQASYEAR